MAGTGSVAEVADVLARGGDTRVLVKNRELERSAAAGCCVNRLATGKTRR
jgi:hypothetical protein